MKRKLVVASLLCLALVAMMAMVAAPSALAKAEILPLQGTETAVSFAAEVVVTGAVAHASGGGTFKEADGGVLIDGVNTSDLAVVFDPVTGEGRCHGTFVLETYVSGTWVGTFAGSMTFPLVSNGWAFLYDIRVTGRGISGDVTGMTFIARNVKDDADPADVTGTLIAPHGF